MPVTFCAADNPRTAVVSSGRSAVRGHAPLVRTGVVRAAPGGTLYGWGHGLPDPGAVTVPRRVILRGFLR